MKAKVLVLDIVFAVAIAGLVSIVCAFVIDAVAGAAGWAIQSAIPDWVPSQWQRTALGLAICGAGVFLVVLPIVLVMLWADPLRTETEPPQPAEREAQTATEVIEDWCIADLAEAHREAHAAGNKEVRDRIERVLEEIAPWWRSHA